MARSSDVLQIVINGIDNATPAFRKIAAGAAIMGVAVAAAFTAAAFKAAKFEKGLAEIATLLDGDVTPAIEKMRGELLDMSVEFGQTIDKLTKARYDIISAGFTDAAESSLVLTAASKLAVAGVSDVAVAADILTDALGGLEVGAEKAEHITDILLQTVRKGKVKLEELAQGFGKVFGTAKVAGVSLEELAASMATATASGVNVTDSITGLNALILAIAAPTEEATKAMEDAGISMDRGFTQSIVDLGNASGESLAKMRELIPSIEALRVAAKIAGNVDLLKRNLLEMNNATGVVTTGFDIMAETFDFKMQQARGALDALVIEVGTLFLPMFKSMFDNIRDVAVVLRFMIFETDIAKTAMGQLAQVMRDELIGALEDLNLVLGGAAAQMAGPVKESFVLVAAGIQKMLNNLTAATRAGDIGKWLENMRDKAIQAGAGIEALEVQGLIDLNTALENGSENWDAFRDRLTEVGANLSGPLADAFAQARAELDALIKTKEEAAAAVATAPEPTKPEGPVVAPIRGEIREANEELQNFMGELGSLAEFTAEDFANLAFRIGDSFGAMMGDIAGSLLGLRDGPIMVGRAIKSMVAGAITDIGRLIARLLVAKALMGLFGGGIGALFFAQGGTVPRAAFGLSVPGGGGEFPAVVLPGSPGLDRTMVAAQGGEVIVSRQEVGRQDRARRHAQAAPRAAARQRARARQPVVIQANRPFRTEENILLRDSVTEGIERGERHVV